MTQQLPCLSISEFNTTIKHLLEDELALDDLWLSGEISNLKSYAKGNQWYFTLSDAQSNLNGFMYETTLSRIGFVPENGQKIVARGRVRFFQKRGQFMFQAVHLSLDGKGDLSQAFEHLKAQLLAEGLFEPDRKLPLPLYPEKVAIVTAHNSAAMWDFLTICHRRAPHIEITVIPAVMQGYTSPDSVIEALTIADDNHYDAIVLMRGGGSAEDLAAFNYEKLVRFIASLTTPLISAIGHEIDFTLSDFVADHRSATPSAAAQDLTQHLSAFKAQSPRQLQFLLNRFQSHLTQTQHSLISQLEQGRQHIENSLSRAEEKLTQLSIRLAQTNPLHKLNQGYSITRHAETQSIISSTTQVSEGETLQIEVKDGSILAKTLTT